jgi:hypothetical protein
MDFLLPNGSLSSLESVLTTNILNTALSSLEVPTQAGSPTQVELLPPKFSFTTRVALDPVLAGLGMPDAFVPERGTSPEPRICPA